MSRKLLAMILLCAMLMSCMPAAATNSIVEANDPKSLSALLEDSSPYRVLLQAKQLTDIGDASRVIHCAATESYILEYETAEAAKIGLSELQKEFGCDACWSDMPSDGASVLGESEAKAFRSWGAAAMELDAVVNDEQIGKHLRKNGITIAIIDTGLDPESTFWADRKISPKSYDFVNASDQMSEVTNGGAAGHGTMVVSLLDDLLPENAEIMILRVFDNNGSAARSTVLNALNYALENGADIINMSLGWEGADSTFTFLNGVLDKAYQQGVPVICASGNRGVNADTCYPASYEKTISVAAVDRGEEHPSFSNYGDSVDLAAPGKDIRTIGLKDRAMVSKGTSFAAPHITAAAAALLLLNDHTNPAQLLDALKSCAKDIGEEGWDVYFGWGIPQLKSAADAALSHDWDEGKITVKPTETAEGKRTFTCETCGEQKEEVIPPTDKPEKSNPFEDVAETAYFFDPVIWAVNHDPVITNGINATHFAPTATCTRAQVVTFLWRAMGEPEPESVKNPFKDVKESDYYYKAVLWAVEQGVTVGTSEDQFSPNRPCTRAHVVTFLWRAESEPEAGAGNPFGDVSSDKYFFYAVLWAVNQTPRITEGTDATHFSPNAPCTRGQIVTFLYRDLAD